MRIELSSNLGEARVELKVKNQTLKKALKKQSSDEFEFSTPLDGRLVLIVTNMSMNEKIYMEDSLSFDFFVHPSDGRIKRFNCTASQKSQKSLCKTVREKGILLWPGTYQLQIRAPGKFTIVQNRVQSSYE